MKKVALIIAGITGATLAVTLWQTPQRKRLTDNLFQRDSVDDFPDPLTFPISKDYFLMKGIIKC